MFLHIEDVIVAGPLRLKLRFNNGERRVVDLVDSLHGPVFEPLREQSRFAAVYVNEETGTIEWPNGADFAPEYLYAISRPVEPSTVAARPA